MAQAPSPPPAAASSPPAVREAAMRLVVGAGLPSGARGLDIPCGEGRLLAALARAGFVAEGGDRDPRAAIAAGLAARTLDLEQPLPYPDGAFGFVTCVEGIEHVEGQAGLVAECARVLAPGGVLVLTTPNVLGRPSRSSLGRHGYARFFRPAPAGAPTPYDHEHVHPIDVVRLEHLLARAGLRLEAFDGDRGPAPRLSLRERVQRAFDVPRLARRNPRADLLTQPAVWCARVVAVRARRARG